MRVTHVVATLNPQGGGPPFVAGSLAVAQAQLGAAVTLLTYASPEPAPDVLNELPASGSVKAEVVRWKGRVARFTGADARPQCRLLPMSADFVHLHGVWEPILRQAASTCRRAGVPYAISPHGMLDPWSLRQSGIKKRIALRLGYRRMLDGAEFVHALNPDEQRLLEPMQLSTRVEVIPNGIFPEQFKSQVPVETLDGPLPQLKRRPYILFLARLHYKKGLDYLADAFAKLTQHDTRIQLVVAGPDDGERDAFQQRIAALGLGSRAHLPGALYGQEKLAALSHAAAFCLPSRQEGFSMAIIEALACGTPCVISDACHFPEVQSAGAGRVVALQADAIAAALTDIIDDPALRGSMSRSAHVLSANYSWLAIARRMLDAYQGVNVSRDHVSAQVPAV